MGADEILGRIGEARMRKALNDDSVRALAKTDQTLKALVDRVNAAEDPAQLMVSMATAVGEAAKSEDAHERVLGTLASLGLSMLHESVVKSLSDDDG